MSSTIDEKIRDLEAALALWLDLYNTTDNPQEKEIAIFYIKRTKLKIDIQFLNEKIEEFHQKEGRLPAHLNELVLYGIVDSLPQEPFG